MTEETTQEILDREATDEIMQEEALQEVLACEVAQMAQDILNEEEAPVE